MHLPESFGEVHRLARNGDEVHVVRHETVSQQGEFMLAQPLPKQIEIDRALGVGGQDILAPVSALRYMMRHVGDNDSCYARHGAPLRAARNFGNGTTQPLAFPQQLPDNLEARPSYRREPDPT